MTASEKAQEILSKFEGIITSDDYPGEAHECAVYHVKEMIFEIGYGTNIGEYYTKVLQELNLL